MAELSAVELAELEAEEAKAQSKFFRFGLGEIFLGSDEQNA
jgi:hypothetical protein